MDKDRLILGIGRMENALSRLERILGDDASAALAPAPSSPAPPSTDTAALQRRHDRLRGEVESAIARIDMLIAREEC